MSNNDNKSCASTSINWYPGHMAKTKKEIVEDLKLIDVVIELLDSRIPLSSQNPDITNITKNKKKIIVLNKADISDSKQNEKWVKDFKEKGQVAILTESNSGKGINEVIKETENLMQEELKKYAEKGRTGRKVKVMVLGIPNVGKSSFINRIAKSNRLEVGNKPGITRKKQWIRVNDKIELLDTPGVLWPKFESQQVALNLSFTGTIKDDILPQTEIAYQLLKFLIENYQEKIEERYNFKKEYIEKILHQNQEENLNFYQIMQEIGRKRGCLVSGGEIDDEKTAKVIIEDYRSGKMGK